MKSLILWRLEADRKSPCEKMLFRVSGCWAAFYDELAAFCLTPESVDVDDVRAYSCDGDFEETLPLSSLEQEAFFLCEPVGDAAATDLCSGRLATAESLYIVFVRFWHAVILLRHCIHVKAKAQQRVIGEMRASCE